MAIVRPEGVLSVNDTFAKWVEKLNIAMKGDFDIDYDTSSGLNLVVKQGVFTEGSRYVELPSTTLTLPTNSELFVCVLTNEANPEITFYEVGDVAIPASEIVPIAVITTTTEITNVKDIRSWASVSGSGGGTAAEGLLVMNATIVRDQKIPTGKNAISVEPAIADGVTVTVEDGCVWSIV